MIGFFLLDSNLIYSVVLAFVLALAVLEGVGVLLGMSLLSLLDDITPMEFSADADSDISPAGLSQFLGWLCLSKLPLLVWLVLICTLFSLTGLTVNHVATSYFQTTSPMLMSVPLSLFVSAMGTHYLGGAIARVMPKSESASISIASFEGHVAQITVGTASQGNAAEAVFTDIHQQKHYVLVEPQTADAQFSQGTRVLLLNKTPHCWVAAEYKDSH